MVLSGSIKKAMETENLPAEIQSHRWIVCVPPLPKIISEAIPRTTRNESPAIREAMCPALSRV